MIGMECFETSDKSSLFNGTFLQAKNSTLEIEVKSSVIFALTASCTLSSFGKKNIPTA